MNHHFSMLWSCGCNFLHYNNYIQPRAWPRIKILNFIVFNFPPLGMLLFTK